MQGKYWFVVNMFQTCKNTYSLSANLTNPSRRLATGSMNIYIIKTQLVLYYQCCDLIGWATARLYVIAH